MFSLAFVLVHVGSSPLANAADRVALRNTSPLPGAVMVTLSDHNEVAGIHFTNMGNHAISATGADYSGTFLHHNTFSGHANEHIEDESRLIYAVSFDAADGARDGIRIERESGIPLAGSAATRRERPHAIPRRAKKLWRNVRRFL